MTYMWYVPAPRYPKYTSFFFFSFSFLSQSRNHCGTLKFAENEILYSILNFRWVQPVFLAHETLCELSFGNNYLAIKTYQYTPLGRSKMLTLKKTWRFNSYKMKGLDDFSIFIVNKISVAFLSECIPFSIYTLIF